MGSTKVATFDAATDIDAEAKALKKVKREAKKREKVNIQEKIDQKVQDNLVAGKDLPPSSRRCRSHSYIAARRNVDRTKFYSLEKAIELLKKSSYSKFNATVSLDLVLRDQTQVEITFPHSTGKTIRVRVADEALLKELDKGVFDFDILISPPALMPKLAKYARTLGPKGLMPNPKNNTVTDDPEKRKKELESGKVQLKTEKKAPLMHVVIGKVDQPDAELQANTEALIKALGPKKIKKLVLSATMSPGVKVDLKPYQSE